MFELAAGLFGAHVGRCPQGGAGQGLGTAAGRTEVQGTLVTHHIGAAAGLRQAPVDNQRLAVLADDDVPRLDIPVQHAPAMGVVDRVAYVDKPVQQLSQLQRSTARLVPQRFIGMKGGDCLLEAVAPDESHRVIGATVGVAAHSVHRHDARMLEPAGDLGFHQKALATRLVISVAVQDLLECDLPV